MTIWADADSLPRQVRELIGRRAGNSEASLPIRAVFVANRTLPLPPGRNLQAVTVGPAGASAAAGNAGRDALPGASRNTPHLRSVASPQASQEASPEASSQATTADDYILSCAKVGDILITRDIPLASKAISAGLVAINDRGTVWTADTVRERLSVRDHLTTLRNMGAMPPPSNAGTFGPRELNAFANALDRAIYSAVRMQPVSASDGKPDN